MWLEAIYEPTSLFSLKASDATNRGAKSLLAPSPYSVKMALLNAMITFGGFDFEPDTDASENPKGKRKKTRATGQTFDAFEAIRDLEIRFALSEKVVVNNCFIRIQKPKRMEGEAKEHDLETMDTTVTFREYVYFSGDLKLAFDLKQDASNSETETLLREFLPKINYFGKRGCFFQFKGFEPRTELPKEEYARELKEGLAMNSLVGCTLAKMDDFNSKASFDNANNFSRTKAKRISRIFLIPRTRKKSNKNFTLYSL